MKYLDLHDFRDQFNQAVDFVRVVTIFSPPDLYANTDKVLSASCSRKSIQKSLKGFRFGSP